MVKILKKYQKSLGFLGEISSDGKRMDVNVRKAEEDQLINKCKIFLLIK